MKQNIDFFRVPVSMIFMFFLITTPILTSCGGGGGESEVGPAGDPTTTPNLLDSQNSKAEEYVSKLQQLIEANDSVDDKLFWVDSTDTAMIDEILEDIEQNYNLAEEVFNIGEEIYEIEQSLQGSDSASMPTDNQTQLKISPQAGPLAVFGVCVSAGISIAAMNVAAENSEIVEAREKRICQKTYDEEKKNIEASEQSVEDKNSQLALAWNKLWSCNKTAYNDSAYKTQEAFTIGGGSIILSAFGPAGLIAATLGNISLISDIATLMVGKEKESDDTINLRAVNDEIDQRKAFIATPDENGLFPVPEGNWDIVAFKPGFARSGTPTGQPITVQEGETTFVDYSTVPTSNASPNDFRTCESSGEPNEDDCEAYPTITIGEEGKYFRVKDSIYYPMPDVGTCYTAEQIAAYREKDAYIIEEEYRGSCTICPTGYTLEDYEGLETCISCPADTYYSNGCCN